MLPRRRAATRTTQLFLGRGINFPVALEAANSRRSPTSAEGYAAGEMKHGPIALIDDMAILVINTAGAVAEKTRANIEQTKARGGVTISVGSDDAVRDRRDVGPGPGDVQYRL